MKHSHTICRFPNKISIIDTFEKFKSESDQALTLPKKAGSGRRELGGGSETSQNSSSF